MADDFKPGDRVIFTHRGAEHSVQVRSVHVHETGRYATFTTASPHPYWGYLKELRHDVPLSPINQAASDYCKRELHR